MVQLATPVVVKEKKRLITVQEFKNFNEAFAVNAYGDVQEGHNFLDGTVEQLKPFGGTVYVEVGDRLYSDTCYIVTPSFSQLPLLPKLINGVDRKLFNILINLWADEKDLTDETWFRDQTFWEYTEEDIQKLDPNNNFVIRLWWD